MKVFDKGQELSLFKKLKSGDTSAFEPFYELTKQSVFYNILSIVKDYEWSEEVLQDTFVTFLEHLEDIDEDSNPLGYLFTISKNHALKFIKKKHKESDYEEISNYEEYSDAPNTKSDDYIFKKMKELLKPKEYRIVILHVLDGLTHKEIAKLLKRPIGTITWAYNNAIKKLQKGLGEEYETV